MKCDLVSSFAIDIVVVIVIVIVIRVLISNSSSSTTSRLLSYSASDDRRCIRAVVRVYLFTWLLQFGLSEGTLAEGKRLL